MDDPKRRRRFVSLAATGETLFAICEQGRLWYFHSSQGWTEDSQLPEIEDQDLLRCYAAAAADKAMADGTPNAEETREAGRRAIYDLGRQHGAAQAIPPPAPDGFVSQLACLLANWLSNLRPGDDCTPLARKVIRAVADWLETRANANPHWPTGIALSVSAASLREEADR